MDLRYLENLYKLDFEDIRLAPTEEARHKALMTWRDTENTIFEVAGKDKVNLLRSEIGLKPYK